MANPTAVSVRKATPYSVACTVEGNDGTFGATADVIPGCFPGPLKTLLTKLYAKSAMDTLNLDGANNGKVRIRHIEGIAAPQTSPATETITWAAQGLNVTAAVSSVSQIEIRLEHSFKR
jgi:hypothetical protein